MRTAPSNLLSLLLVAFMAVMVSSALAQAPDHVAVFERVIEQFEPTKPTVVITYSVTYRLLGMKLLSIATASIEATEGRWRFHDGNATPACLILVTLKSNRTDAEAKRKGRVYINDRILSVATMPELNTLFYIKRTDEYINPPLARDKRVDNIAVYDLQTGILDYLAYNYLTDECHTNLTGASDMAAQGKEVSKILMMVSDVYHGRRDPITPESDFRIQVNCDGVAVPFAADTCKDNITMMGKRWPALRAEVMPAREAPRVNHRDFSMWATSFEEVARQLDDPVLTRLAAEAPVWGMAPLLANYGLSLGHIRCAVVSIVARETSPDSEPHLVSWITDTPVPSQPRGDEL